jgi:heme-degrading monooxygenase HmoA
MIVRLWRGEAATPAKAHAYFEHVTGTVFPSLKALPGHIDAWLLRREVDGKTEFVAMTLWTSLDAIKAFAGGDIATAIVEPEAQAVLSSFDGFASHYEVAFRSGA